MPTRSGHRALLAATKRLTTSNEKLKQALLIFYLSSLNKKEYEQIKLGEPQIHRKIAIRFEASVQSARPYSLTKHDTEGSQKAETSNYKN